MPGQGRKKESVSGWEFVEERCRKSLRYISTIGLLTGLSGRQKLAQQGLRLVQNDDCRQSWSDNSKSCPAIQWWACSVFDQLGEISFLMYGNLLNFHAAIVSWSR